jgi:hypothetical integral membrane protein (TIGR02206 family)
MFTDEPFIIFGSDHLIALGLIFISIIIIPYLVLTLKEKTQNVISTSLAFLILLNEFSKPIYYPALYPDYFSILKILPLHFCHLSAICAATFLLSRKKIFFEISFFWGIAGGLIANTQPDIRFAFPDPNFILFFFGHGLMWLGIFFSLIVYKVRPYFKTFIKIFFITVFLSPVVYSINSFINYFAEGNPANYWYLMARPDGASIADFLPDPPAQIPIFVLLAFIIFALIYTPFAVWDKLKR